MVSGDDGIQFASGAATATNDAASSPPASSPSSVVGVSGIVVSCAGVSGSPEDQSVSLSIVTTFNEQRGAQDILDRTDLLRLYARDAPWEDPTPPLPVEYVLLLTAVLAYAIDVVVIEVFIYFCRLPCCVCRLFSWISFSFYSLRCAAFVSFLSFPSDGCTSFPYLPCPCSCRFPRSRFLFMQCVCVLASLTFIETIHFSFTTYVVFSLSIARALSLSCVCVR